MSIIHVASLQKKEKKWNHSHIVHAIIYEEGVLFVDDQVHNCKKIASVHIYTILHSRKI